MYVPVVVLGKPVLMVGVVYISSIARCTFEVFCYSRVVNICTGFSYFIVALSTMFLDDLQKTCVVWLIVVRLVAAFLEPHLRLGAVSIV
jgi:hypothetical protein